MKPMRYLPGLCIALVFSAPMAAQARHQAAKPHHPIPACTCDATPVSGTLAVEHGVTVYRAAPRPWQSEARQSRRDITSTQRMVVVRPYRYNYLAVDTRSRGEWGPMYAVYQNF